MTFELTYSLDVTILKPELLPFCTSFGTDPCMVSHTKGLFSTHAHFTFLQILVLFFSVLDLFRTFLVCNEFSQADRLLLLTIFCLLIIISNPKFLSVANVIFITYLFVTLFICSLGDLHQRNFVVKEHLREWPLYLYASCDGLLKEKNARMHKAWQLWKTDMVTVETGNVCYISYWLSLELHLAYVEIWRLLLCFI